VIYYNFPELHRSGTKINKTCCDKLISYYEKEGFDDEYMFKKEDSLLVIINEPVSESLSKNIEEMYSKGQDELLNYGLSEDIQADMKKNNYMMDHPYFRNIHLFHINSLIVNLLKHRLVPTHEAIRDKDTIEQILQKTNASLQLLPVILRTDAIAKLIRLCPGNICKITRYSEKCGVSEYYRVCK
jgi:DNA-directed RNA polymerase subunit H (RpoH/RPB5)